MSVAKTSCVVLLSGRGTNLAAILKAAQAADYPAMIAGVVANKADAPGLQLARAAGLPVTVVPNANYPDRDSYDAALQVAVDAYAPALVVLAGFMRILSPAFVNHYAGQMINIHPSLLPSFTGLHTHQRALEAQDREHGCSVHFVTEELDGGPLVVQAVIPVESEDTPSSLAQRVHAQEHRIYPLAVRWFAEDRLSLDEQGALLDGQLLPASGHQIQI